VSDELRAADLEAVRQQLGREPLIPFSVVARCTIGHPFVIRNRPIDPEGNPFPTIYWLTCPDTVKLVSQLESEGWIASLNNRYDVDPEFREAVDEAHGAYAAEREEMLPGAGGGGGVGGTRRKIKCLHAHYAYHLAGGDDVVGRWTAERVEPVHPSEPGSRVAAIDQGTNSTRLLVLEPREEDVPLEIARDMVITRLGQGVDEKGRLDPAAIDRAVTAIARFSLRARALNAERIRIGATSAVRDSENRDQFLLRVRDVTGIDPVVIDGEREAALSFLGGTRGLDPADGPFLLIDIGGGSTEFVFGRAPTIVDHAISTQMGSVRLTERVRPSDAPTEDDLRAFGTLIEPHLDEVERAVPARDARTLVAVAGTATTLQACALGLERYDPDLIHRSTLTLEDAERTLRELAAMTNEERAAIPVMPKGRGDVIVAGARILVDAMRRFGFDEALVSETDILDGLALELLNVR
jgi:exopolyphosphatase / guanosine-5'-triphosphate,3'-diphosphate pyrophosphatase